MSEHDDQVSRRYRDLTREEPPAVLDAAIRAQAQRAAAWPRPRSHWMGVVSIAAVLVLALGITLRLQHDDPAIEAAPVPAAAAPHVQPAPAAPQATTPARVEPQPQPPAQPLQTAKPARARAVENRIATPSSAADPPRPFAADVAPSAPPPSPPMPQAAPAPEREASIAARRAERSNPGASSENERVAQLERIASLREAGKAAEADEALARFRERWPGYPIPDALWQRVRPR